MATSSEQPLMASSASLPLPLQTPPPSPTAGYQQPYPQPYPQQYQPQYQQPQYPPQGDPYGMSNVDLSGVFSSSAGAVASRIESGEPIEFSPMTWKYIGSGFLFLIIAVAYTLWFVLKKDSFIKWAPTISVAISSIAFIFGLVFSKDEDTRILLFTFAVVFLLFSIILYFVSNASNIKEITVQDWISLSVSILLCLFSIFIGVKVELYGIVGLTLPTICVFLLLFGVMYNSPYGTNKPQ